MRKPRPHDPARRRMLLRSLGGAGLLVTGSLLAGCSDDDNVELDSASDGSGGSGGSGTGGGTVRPAMPDGVSATPISQLGALGEPDDNGLRLPEGFASRVVAVTGEAPYAGSPYVWHVYPDGGATYSAAGGGWIYVSNSESIPGGVGALEFDAGGRLMDAYAIQTGTIANCAGGPTPWGTWLTCEEYEGGHVFECDPQGRSAVEYEPNIRRALGTFKHEAAAVDPTAGVVYMTEDDGEGGFYRFVCDAYPSLARGRLQIAQVVGDDPMSRRPIVWHDVPEPNPQLAVVNQALLEARPELGEIPGLGAAIAAGLENVNLVVGTPTREQVAEATPFDGGEGIWYHEGIVFFTTKGDNRVWALDTNADTIEVIYDDDLFDDPVLTGVDNVTVSPRGDVLVAEDGGDMQVVALAEAEDGERRILPIVQVVNQPDSEITGPAFSPDGKRLYFSSQRGTRNADGPDTDGGFGITYEIRGLGANRFFEVDAV